VQRNHLALLVFVLLAGTVGVFLISGGGSTPIHAPTGAADDEAIDGDRYPDAMPAAVDRTAVEVGGGAFAPEGAGSDRGRLIEIGLRGRVVDTGGAPIAGAEVIIAVGRGGGPGGRGGRQGNRTAEPVLTGDDGVFRQLGRVARDATIDIRVSHPSFARASVEREIEPGEGGRVDVGDIVLLVGGMLRGRITAPGGNGFPGAAVTVVADGERGRGGFGGPGGGGGRGGADALPEAEADRGGAFAILHVPPGAYRVRATAPGQQRASSDAVEVVDGSVTDIGDLQLEPGFRITGTVFDPDGKPVPRADVAVRATDRRGGEFRSRTDRDGKFEIDHLPDASMSLTAEHAAFLTLELGDVRPSVAPALVLRMNRALSIRGTVVERGSRKPVTRYAVRAERVGDLPDPTRDAQRAALTAELDRVREALRSAREAGTSADALRAQFEGMRSRFEALGQEGLREAFGGRGGRDRGRQGPAFEGGDRGGPPGRGQGRVDEHADGRFELGGLQEGVYVVEVRSPDHIVLESAPVELRATVPSPELTLSLERGLVVRGIVVDIAGRPVAGAEVELQAVEESESTPREGGGRNGGRDRGGLGALFTQLREQAGPRGRTVARTETDRAGRFVYQTVAVGKFLVTARAEGFARARSEPFVVQGEEGASVELRLGVLASLSGQVRGIPAGREAEVHIAVTSGFGFGRGGDGGMRSVRVDARGAYRVDDLEPGSYLVRAYLGDRRELMRQEITRTLENGSIAFDVVLAAGEAKTFDPALTITLLGAVDGVVMHNGAPAAGFHVSLRAVEAGEATRAAPGGAVAFAGLFGGGRRGGGFGRSFDATVGQEGRFVVRDVPPGDYTLTVSAGGRDRGRLHEAPVRVDTSTTTVHVRVTTGGITGRIVPEAGGNEGELRGSVQLLAGVTELPQDLRGARRNAVTNARIVDGKFEAERVPVGQYLLVASVNGRQPTAQPVFVGAGSPTRVDVTAGPKVEPGVAGAPDPNGGPGTEGRRGRGGGGRGGGGRGR
jgi:protocatechuate 3,4-dioxygenase beta subunit